MERDLAGNARIVHPSTESGLGSARPSAGLEEKSSSIARFNAIRGEPRGIGYERREGGTTSNRMERKPGPSSCCSQKEDPGAEPGREGGMLHPSLGSSLERKRLEPPIIAGGTMQKMVCRASKKP